MLHGGSQEVQLSLPITAISLELNQHAGPLRRWQHQRIHQLPIHNGQQHFRRRLGVIVVDEMVGLNNWLPMAAGIGANHLAGVID